LFRQDAGALQAYLVDAETSELSESLADGQREQELMIMMDNVAGELADLGALMPLPHALGVSEVGASIRERYEALWSEINRVETISPSESYRIHERIRKLSDLGFSVSEVELVPTGEGNTLRMRPIVTDRDYHRRLLLGLTGISADERQASALLNEIQELRATMAREGKQSVPVSAAAYRWLHERFNYTTQRLAPLVGRIGEAPEVYCRVLEHKWLLSERAGHDVGLENAIEDFLKLSHSD